MPAKIDPESGTAKLTRTSDPAGGSGRVGLGRFDAADHDAVGLLRLVLGRLLSLYLEHCPPVGMRVP